jgi:hypothetical protein
MTGVMETGSSGSGPPTPDYNLFRRIEDPEFFCAVAQDKPVPPFLTADVWQFVGGGGGGKPGTADTPGRPCVGGRPTRRLLPLLCALRRAAPRPAGNGRGSLAPTIKTARQGISGINSD